MIYPYDYQYFHKELLDLISRDYHRYKNAKEVDLLIEYLNNEWITDYSKVYWRWISTELYGEEYYDGQHYYFDINGELETFISHFASHEIRINILTYLRDNCHECLFNGFYSHSCIENFEKECSRLIYINSNPLRPDEYHGAYADTQSLKRNNVYQTTIIKAPMIQERIEMKIKELFNKTYNNTVVEKDNGEESKERKEQPCIYINLEVVKEKNNYTVNDIQTMLRHACEQGANELVDFLIKYEQYGYLDFHGASKKAIYLKLRETFPTMRDYTYQNFSAAWKKMCRQ